MISPEDFWVNIIAPNPIELFSPVLFPPNSYACIKICVPLATSLIATNLISSWFLIMTSSNGNIFRVTGYLCGELTGHRCIPLTKASDQSGDLMFSLIFAWTNDWVNNRDGGDLRHHRAHYDVTVMFLLLIKRISPHLHMYTFLWPHMALLNPNEWMVSVGDHNLLNIHISTNLE